MKSDLQTCIEEAGYECRSYSGRGMYGKYCLGVDLDGSVYGFVADVMLHAEGSTDTMNEIASHFHNMETDAMGLGKVVYFRNVEYG